MNVGKLVEYISNATILCRRTYPKAGLNPGKTTGSEKVGVKSIEHCVSFSSHRLYICETFPWSKSSMCLIQNPRALGSTKSFRHTFTLSYLSWVSDVFTVFCQWISCTGTEGRWGCPPQHATLVGVAWVFRFGRIP